MKVIEKSTGIVYYATYSRNRLGNLRMWVNGRFYSDREFDRKFSIVKSAQQ